MGMNEVFTHPCYEVVLEHAFDELVQQIWGKQLMDIGTRETVCKGLSKKSAIDTLNLLRTHHNFLVNTKHVPHGCSIKIIDKVVGLLMGSLVSCLAIQVIRHHIAPARSVIS